MNPIFGLIVLSFLTLSCGKNSSPTQSQSVADTTADGGSVTGGSNSIDGKSIEEYVIRVQELPEYQSVLNPIITRLEYLSPRLAIQLKNSLSYTRTWYLVPGELQSISNQEIAVPLSKQTGQFALHYQKSVWLSHDKRQTLLNTRKSEALKISAKHILHEMVMSIRVDKNLKNKTKALSEKDYEDIRAVTDYLFSRSYMAHDMENFLAIHGFSNESADPESIYDTLNLPRDLLIKKLDISTGDKLFRYLSTRNTSDLPSVLYGDSTKPLGHCQFKFNENEKSVTVYTDYTPPDASSPLAMKISLKGKARVLIGENILGVRVSEGVEGQDIQKNLVVKIKNNQLRDLSFYITSKHRWFREDQSWRYEKYTINCFSKISSLPARYNFLDYLKHTVERN